MTDTAAFADRHIGPSHADQRAMLAALGVPSVETLIHQTVPQSIRLGRPLDLPAPASEAEALAELGATMARNTVLKSFIGRGYHGVNVPPVIQRNLFENPAWYTAYTPYQAEISQGRLEMLFNFQTLVTELTGLPVASASLLDEATAVAEAVGIAFRFHKEARGTVVLAGDLHPQILDVVRTRCEPLGISVVSGAIDSAAAALIVPWPDTYGVYGDHAARIAEAKAAGAVVIFVADPLGLVPTEAPAKLGADIAVGSMQRFGVPMGYGGPHAAYCAVSEKLTRLMPGRLVGQSVDAHGRPGYRLALQTREQHIRRDKATSNICTAQALLAIIASMYGVYHGPEGLRHIARRVATHAAVLAKGLAALGWSLTQTQFFDTVTVRVPAGQDAIIARAVAAGLNLRRDAAALGISCDETTTPEIIARIWEAFGAAPGSKATMPRYDALAKDTQPALPQALHRTSDFMAHPVFHKYRSETEMLRYLRRLSDRDLALDRTMIPLGSCTMKLNATAEMMPLTWAGFAQMHPFAPDDQARGYAELFDDLKAKLVAVSGYDAVSLQPNSGAQGEYAGLLAIRAYHRSRGDAQRTICLIPTSAHGTNPASAQMVGMTVVTVACDSAGNVDVADLERKAAQSGDRLAALMITYPSTHGVFETAITKICEIIHAHGGQVYLDGANLNALVGLARPGDCGADVSHFNLHKTFCIPHGGGGPGMGPIGVKKHLAPFLPGDPRVHDGSKPAGPVSAAPFGSASILTIAWAYILMMGGKGLTDATKIAILNANYIAQRLQGHYPLLFRGEAGRVAHECIIDIRGFKETSGVTVDDVAKRLIDYGFHAPTMSFPVAGTLMIEPTESESLAEIDRFCDAMIAIRDEIRSIESGTYSRDDNPLRNAPHTLADLVEASWSHCYSREVACLPGHVVAADKYWSPVNRIDGVHGDRNLICSCPPLDSYSDTIADAPMLQAAK
ncbi:MAG: aminomethyl-transferring glycine dehydrogenase [Pseudolabrys sp.]|nr:aminomethyl-transferring glycine dehydrogenase [Pseudolabrys sp.]